ncbi:helix-turn-helix domain-containing protein [Thermopolyspora sp. NPDC052614]|uniref:helix-turn-helix domain-containing protein n=1 Tax=Thermopolyspora sp. NPDC052614 TaxID=3155682 RepID=UPI003439C1A9
MAEDWLTSDEAARMLGVTPARVHALARSGQLAFRMAGRTRLIDPMSVHRRSTRLRRAGRPMTSTAAAIIEQLAGVHPFDRSCLATTM